MEDVYQVIAALLALFAAALTTVALTVHSECCTVDLRSEDDDDSLP